MRQGAYNACAIRVCGLIEWWAEAAETGEKYPYCDALRWEMRNSPTPGDG